MAFDITFEAVPVSEFKEQYATSKDTMLTVVCREINEMLTEKLPEGAVTPPLTLTQLEMGSERFQDWQTRQRDRRSNPQDDKDKTAQVITLDAIARKMNAESDKSGFKALRRDGKLAFAHAADFTKADDES